MDPKKVFVAASITGGREFLPIVRMIVDFFQTQEYEVLSIHNASDNPVQTFVEKIGNPNAIDDNSFRDYDCRWIEEADFFVAEVSTPSHGVGAEFQHCYLKPKMGLPRTPMLCFYHNTKTVSPMIAGISKQEANYIWLRKYDFIKYNNTKAHIAIILRQFIDAFG